jgi:two-component system response regulator
MMRRFRPVHVLIVEDNPDDIEIAQRAFARSGMSCELSVVRDGREVLDTLGRAAENPGQGLPDFILLDINLPLLNGFGVLEGIRGNPAWAIIPVVMLTASGREEDVTRSYQLGANSYMQKPIAFDQFQTNLATLGEYWFSVATLPQAS